jgi:hypothetical protein
MGVIVQEFDRPARRWFAATRWSRYRHRNAIDVQHVARFQLLPRPTADPPIDPNATIVNQPLAVAGWDAEHVLQDTCQLAGRKGNRGRNNQGFLGHCHAQTMEQSREDGYPASARAKKGGEDPSR